MSLLDTHIIAHMHFERNKTFILLRSVSPKEKGQCMAQLNPCADPLLLP